MNFMYGFQILCTIVNLPLNSIFLELLKIPSYVDTMSDNLCVPPAKTVYFATTNQNFIMNFPDLKMKIVS